MKLLFVFILQFGSAILLGFAKREMNEIFFRFISEAYVWTTIFLWTEYQLKFVGWLFKKYGKYEEK